MSKINNANSDKFKMVFSNIPIPATRTRPPDLEVFNNYVKSVTLPDYSLETLESRFQGATVRYPSSQFNDNLSQITIEFFVDEDMENYKAFFDWIDQIRRGCNAKGESTLLDSNIKQMKVLVLDNENRRTNTLTFKDCWLLSMSALSLIFGSSEQLQFSCTFSFDVFEIESTTETLNN